MKKRKNSVLIIIPAYNESENIINVIDSLSTQNSDWDTLVINDGSTDDTGELASQTGKTYVINLPIKLGIGSCVQTGFKFARQHHYEYALRFDGDGQHKACEINKLLEIIENKQADIAIGSRFCKKPLSFKTTPLRYFGITVFKIVNSILIDQKITDNTSGFRAYNQKAINFLAEHYPADYPEPEAVILLGRNEFRLKESYTEMEYRQGGKSSISGISTIYYMIKVLLSVILTYIRPKIKIEETNGGKHG